MDLFVQPSKNLDLFLYILIISIGTGSLTKRSAKVTSTTGYGVNLKSATTFPYTAEKRKNRVVHKILYFQSF